MYLAKNRVIQSCEIFVKVKSHQIRLAWKWYGWADLMSLRIVHKILNLTWICSPNSIAKHDLLCMQFAVNAWKEIKKLTGYLLRQHQKLFKHF